MLARAASIFRSGARLAHTAASSAAAAPAGRKAMLVIGATLGLGSAVVYIYTDETAAEKKVINILIAGPPGSGKGTLPVIIRRETLRIYDR